VTDPAERERLYWQRDHLRLFGMDYGDRLRAAGFEVTEDRYVAEIGEALQERYALMSDEILYFCRKA